MSKEIKKRILEQFVFSEFFNKEVLVNLPEMLGVADAWLRDRPTMRSIYEMGDDLYHLKMHFLKIYRRYVVGAEEEAEELLQAKTKENQIEELGDATFYLLHFFKAVDLDIDQLREYLNDRKLVGEDVLSELMLFLPNMAGRALILESIGNMRSSLRRSHNLIFGGPSSFGENKTDAPWLNDRDSQQWLDFEKGITLDWLIAFVSAMRLASKMEIDMPKLIEKTAKKAGKNFPIRFFDPKFSWFSWDLNGDEEDVACCRLFRKTLNSYGISYLELFYQKQAIKEFTPESFRVFVEKSLSEIEKNSESWEAKDLLSSIEYAKKGGDNV